MFLPGLTGESMFMIEITLRSKYAVCSDMNIPLKGCLQDKEQEAECNAQN